jgi:bacteriocin-like protein
MEKIMRKTTDTEPKPELTEAELNAVSGGQREPTYHPAKVTIPDLKLS